MVPSIEDDTPITTMADVPRVDHAPEIQKEIDAKPTTSTIKLEAKYVKSANQTIQDKF